MQNGRGIFYGIGVGPGDPELLTVKAINALKKIDAVIAPKTEKKEGSVALSIVEPYLREDVEVVYQTFPMIKDFAESKVVFNSNKQEILSLLDGGKNVAFLTLGDPMFFSTYIYVFQLLKDCGVQIETIPGVPAFLAIASYIGRPLVFGNDIITIIPATAEREKIEDALKISDVTVLMKVYKNFPEVVEMLDAEKMLSEAVLVSRCGLAEEKIITDLKQNQSEKVNYLSTILTCRKNN